LGGDIRRSAWEDARMNTNSESDLERAIDARVQRRLQTDPRYRYAENAEEQAEAEAAIEAEVIAELERKAWKRQSLAAAYIGPGQL
jgi:hypothetical protein